MRQFCVLKLCKYHTRVQLYVLKPFKLSHFSKRQNYSEQNVTGMTIQSRSRECRSTLPQNLSVQKSKAAISITVFLNQNEFYFILSQQFNFHFLMFFLCFFTSWSIIIMDVFDTYFFPFRVTNRIRHHGLSYSLPVPKFSLSFSWWQRWITYQLKEQRKQSACNVHSY